MGSGVWQALLRGKRWGQGRCLRWRTSHGCRPRRRDWYVHTAIALDGRALSGRVVNGNPCSAAGSVRVPGADADRAWAFACPCAAAAWGHPRDVRDRRAVRARSEAACGPIPGTVSGGDGEGTEPRGGVAAAPEVPMCTQPNAPCAGQGVRLRLECACLLNPAFEMFGLAGAVEGGGSRCW